MQYQKKSDPTTVISAADFAALPVDLQTLYAAMPAVSSKLKNFEEMPDATAFDKKKAELQASGKWAEGNPIPSEIKALNDGDEIEVKAALNSGIRESKSKSKYGATPCTSALAPSAKPFFILTGNTFYVKGSTIKVKKSTSEDGRYVQLEVI